MGAHVAVPPAVRWHYLFSRLIIYSPALVGPALAEA